MKRTILAFAFVAFALVGMAQSSRPSVTIFGDSYSTFEGYLTPDTMETWYFQDRDMNRTDVTQVRQTWWWQVIQRMGWKLERNNSWSGSTICNTGYNDADYTHRSFITRMTSLGSPDVILIFGGTNDAWSGAPVGEYMYSGWRRADLYTFRPALAYLLDGLQEHYPTAQLVFISNNDLKESITKSIHEICRHYGVQVIQLEGIEKQSGHPNQKGMTQIADQVVKALKK